MFDIKLQRLNSGHSNVRKISIIYCRFYHLMTWVDLRSLHQPSCKCDNWIPIDEAGRSSQRLMQPEMYIWEEGMWRRLGMWCNVGRLGSRPCNHTKLFSTPNSMQKLSSWSFQNIKNKLNEHLSEDFTEQAPYPSLQQWKGWHGLEISRLSFSLSGSTAVQCG